MSGVRLVRVSTVFLDLFLRGEMQNRVASTTAPPDLRVVGVRGLRDEAVEFVVESASFGDLRPGEDVYFLPTYTVGPVPRGLRRLWRRFRAAWRVA